MVLVAQKWRVVTTCECSIALTGIDNSLLRLATVDEMYVSSNETITVPRDPTLQNDRQRGGPLHVHWTLARRPITC